MEELDDNLYNLNDDGTLIFFTNQRPINWLTRQTTDYTESTYWQALLYEQAPAKTEWCITQSSSNIAVINVLL